MRDFPPTNERRSQGQLTHLRTVTMRALGGSTAKKYAQLTHTSSPPGTKLSPFSRSVGPTGTKFSLLSRPTGSPGTKLPLFSRSSGPTGTKLSLFSRSRGSPGTKLSQHPQKGPFQPVLPEQGELCTARTTTTPSRENFVPHTKPIPVQNSPHTPKKAHFQGFCPSRENFVPLPPPRPPAGRTLYRTQSQTRYKTLPASPFYSDSAKKFAQHTPHHNRTAKKFAQHT